MNKILSLDVRPAADDIVRQLKTLVPVRTGRLKKGIKYNIKQDGAVFTIQVILEDYFAWIKPRKKPLPGFIALDTTPAASLPKMNTLGRVDDGDLSSRSHVIMTKLDLKNAVDKIDLTELEVTIKDIIDKELTL